MVKDVNRIVIVQVKKCVITWMDHVLVKLDFTGQTVIRDAPKEPMVVSVLNNVCVPRKWNVNQRMVFVCVRKVTMVISVS